MIEIPSGPEADAIRAWRALSVAERRAYFASTPQGQLNAALRDAVNACPDRGSVLPISQQPQNCTQCGELSECRAGKGKLAGRVTLRECLQCKSQNQNQVQS